MEMTAPAIKDAGTPFGLIADELAMVEAEFERQARSSIGVIDRLGAYLRASGGKRVRPSLLILAAYACGSDGSSPSAIRLAAVMEMLHTATLVHDDIIDNASVRRGRPTVNIEYGNHVAVLMGDWLYMTAFQTSLAERSLEILDILTELTRKMTEGEMLQLTLIGSASVSEEQYFDILRRKTAYLFAGCCEIGAILAGVGDEVRNAMREYGMELGTAFQLADDLLDLTAESGQLGKPAGADLLEGKLTLPLIRLVRREPELRVPIERAASSGTYDDGLRELIFERLRTNGSLAETAVLARHHAARARKNLEVLGETRYRSALDEIAGFVTDRTK
jgi:octaprenyl-diphosphate synthase